MLIPENRDIFLSTTTIGLRDTRRNIFLLPKCQNGHLIFFFGCTYICRYRDSHGMFVSRGSECDVTCSTKIEMLICAVLKVLNVIAEFLSKRAYRRSGYGQTVLISSPKMFKDGFYGTVKVPVCCLNSYI